MKHRDLLKQGIVSGSVLLIFWLVATSDLNFVPRELGAPTNDQLYRLFLQIPLNPLDRAVAPERLLDKGGPVGYIQSFVSTQGPSSTIEHYKNAMTTSDWTLSATDVHLPSQTTTLKFCKGQISASVSVRPETEGSAYGLSVLWTSNPRDKSNYCLRAEK